MFSSKCGIIGIGMVSNKFICGRSIMCKCKG